MKFESNTAAIDLLPGLSLHRGMKRSEVLATSAEWENWNTIDGVSTALRTIINLPNKNMSSKTILIVYVRPEGLPIAFWDISPRDLVKGVQNQREGKYTKQMRNWFKTMFDTKIPCGGEWGHLDSSYDPWNQTAGIVCNYRERFTDEKDWNLYKSRNKFK